MVENSYNRFKISFIRSYLLTVIVLRPCIVQLFLFFTFWFWTLKIPSSIFSMLIMSRFLFFIFTPLNQTWRYFAKILILRYSLYCFFLVLQDEKWFDWKSYHIRNLGDRGRKNKNGMSFGKTNHFQLILDFFKLSLQF